MSDPTEIAEWQTMVLGPYEDVLADPYAWTLPILPQIRSGHTKVFPPRATLGPPDPDLDDTLTTLNFQDLSAGQGVSRINPGTDLSRTWWHTADCRGTDGWTNPPESLATRPAVYSGNCTPVGRIGDSTYALWGTQLHRWNPDLRTWSNSLGTIGTLTADPVAFDDYMFFPLGASGYAYVGESAPGVLGAITIVPGTAAPTANDPLPSNAPKALCFAVWRGKLYALTTKSDGHYLCSLLPEHIAAKSWYWPYDTAFTRFVRIERSFVPKLLIQWLDAQLERALWVVGRRGAMVFDDDTATWEETNLWGVPPHPNFGRAALQWRPGEAIFITSGGGDLIQYTNSNVAQPGQGPGGRGEGMPVDKRGDIISMTSDLANMYALVQAETVAGVDPEFVEDTEGSDAIYLASANAVSSVIANTGKGWHPLWESTESSGSASRIVVADSPRADGSADYRVFWGVGQDCWDMPCRLSTYSSRQGRQAGIDRFAPGSYIEWGEFNAASISQRKLASHAYVLLEHGAAAEDGTPLEYVEYFYQTDADVSSEWHRMGLAWAPNSRTIFPFGLSDDQRFSKGLTFRWIKQRLRLVGRGGLYTPTVLALGLAWLPLTQDATHGTFTIPLPVETDERSGKTTEQIHELVHRLLNHTDDEFLLLRVGPEEFRVAISGAAHTEIAGDDAVGAITLSLIQIPTGIDTLVGEPN